MKSYDVRLSARVTLNATIEVMDAEGKDEALRLGEIQLAQSIGKEMSDLEDLRIEQCIFVDPTAEADYAAAVMKGAGL